MNDVQNAECTLRSADSKTKTQEILDNRPFQLSGRVPSGVLFHTDIQDRSVLFDHNILMLFLHYY